MTSGRSGLMYLCGQPGTANLRHDSNEEEDFELFLYNAMTYRDVK
jgi:hypothetical protein